MASCEAETAKTMEKKRKKIPSGVVELIDLAIYCFCSISGLKSNDKVRGSPVVLGVTAIFFQMLKVAKVVTQEEFKEQFGDVDIAKPGSFEKAVCSRLLKYAKAKTLNETGRPDTPSSLLERKEIFDEATERVRTKRYPRCWRCRERCRCCLLRKKSKPVAPFGSELMSPFLSSLDDIASRKEFSDSPDDDEAHMPEGLENISDDEAEKLMERFLKEDISDDEFNEQDSDDEEETSEEDEE